MKLRAWVLGLVVAGCGGTAPVPAAPKVPEGMKPWDEATANTEAIAGLVPVRLRRDHAVLLELTGEVLERDLGVHVGIARGLGAHAAVDGTSLVHAQMLQLRRVGDKVYAIRRDPTMVASPGTGHDVGIPRDQGESVLAAMPILSEHPDGRVLVDATAFLTSDYTNLAAWFKPLYGGTPDTALSLDPARSFVERVQGYPENVEIDTTLTFAAPNAPTGVILPATPTDPRALSVGLRWSLYALPDEPMPTRDADVRIGYFVEPRLDFDRVNITETDPARDAIRRWRLDKVDPSAARSRPVKPIRFYLDPSIPEAYRPFVREGVLAWNKAFDAAGFEDAIVVEDAPADFDYEDIRYSSIHWSTTSEPPFSAIGPSQVDPRTGEILNADITVIADFLRWTGRVLRTGTAGACEAADGLAQELMIGRVLGATAGYDPEVDAGDAIRALVMHEVGHTIGLRHNFHGSASTPRDRLDDPEWIEAHGLSASVMDYLAYNHQPSSTAPRFQTGVGDYDVFAIRYGYTPVADATALAAIADASTDPRNAYATDEDNWLGAWAPDPTNSGYDLGDDPVAYAAERVAMVDEAIPKLSDALVPDGGDLSELRAVIGSTLSWRTLILDNAIRSIGGVTTRRARKGDPIQPLTPVPVDQQRAALALVIREAFADDAVTLSAELLGSLAPVREHRSWAQLEQGLDVPIDLPIHRVLLADQVTLLRSILASPRLERIVDNQVRVAKGEQALAMSELFGTLTDGIFGELDAKKPTTTAARRNLQRAYVDELIAIVNAAAADAPIAQVIAWGAPAAYPPPPSDARAQARHSLAALTKQAAKLAPSATDADTRAHLEDLAARIDAALDATVVRP